MAVWLHCIDQMASEGTLGSGDWPIRTDVIQLLSFDTDSSPRLPGSPGSTWQERDCVEEFAHDQTPVLPDVAETRALLPFRARIYWWCSDSESASAAARHAV
jgi:hypothetical protein